MSIWPRCGVCAHWLTLRRVCHTLLHPSPYEYQERLISGKLVPRTYFWICGRCRARSEARLEREAAGAAELAAGHGVTTGQGAAAGQGATVLSETDLPAGPPHKL